MNNDAVEFFGSLIVIAIISLLLAWFWGWDWRCLIADCVIVKELP